MHYVCHTNNDSNHLFHMDLSLVLEKAALALSGFRYTIYPKTMVGSLVHLKGNKENKEKQA